MIVPTRLLAGLAAMFGLVLALEWLLPGPTAPAASVPMARLHAPGRAPVLPARRTALWAQAILARPVFSVSRRPPKAAAGNLATAGPGQARLAGIMITRYGRRAIFAPEGGGHALVVAEGGSVNQTTIRSILPDRVVLAGGAVLRPAYDRNRPASTTVPLQPALAPFAPGFQAFPNATSQFGNPAFQPPGFPPPGFTPPFQPPGVPTNGQDGTQPVAPAQPFRGGLLPQRRE